MLSFEKKKDKLQHSVQLQSQILNISSVSFPFSCISVLVYNIGVIIKLTELKIHFYNFYYKLTSSYEVFSCSMAEKKKEEGM